MSSGNMDTSPETGTRANDVESTGGKAKPGDQQPAARVALLLTSLMTTVFLVALDRTIITTAIPRITDEFNSLSDVGWYGSGYLLASCSFQLLLGKVYTFYPIRPILLGNVFLFEAGSAICGAAPSSQVFIFGRVLQGVGAAGIFSGCIICIVYVVPLEKRPVLQGLFGAIFGVAAIVGPLVGGAFTSHVTWRWCFYINLPVGAVASVVIWTCLRVPDLQIARVPWTEKLWQLDLPGTVVLIGSMVCLVLALQWGGQDYKWSSGIIISLLAIMGVLGVAFIVIQVLLPNTATIPPRVFKQRSIIAGCFSTICVGGSLYIFTYFLPIWFQTIAGASAVDSGIRLLPTMLSMAVATMTGGVVTRKTGYYTPVAIIGACIMAIGAGLLTTLQVHTASSRWIGYQIVYGFGLGLTFQAPNLAAQTVLPIKDVPIGTSLMFFGQLLGAAIFVPVGVNVLNNELFKRLAGLPGFDPSIMASAGATTVLTSLPPDVRTAALVNYNEALRTVFNVGLIITCLNVLGSAGLEWKSMLKKPSSMECLDPSSEPQKDGESKDTAAGVSGA